MTARTTARSSLPVVLITVFGLLAAACGSGGPNLTEVVESSSRVGDRTSAATAGIDGGVGVDAVWTAEGTPTQVADSMAGNTPPDERTDDANGDVFMLYSSGTLWMTAAAAGTAVVLYNDNDQAYSRHNGILIRNNRWGTRVNDYRSSNSSSNNGFRGGGSSSGK